MLRGSMPDLETIRAISQVIANAATALVATAAAFWFFFSRRFAKRVQFDAEFKIFKTGNPDNRLLEVMLLLDNKGQVEHYCYTLAFEVVEIGPDGRSVPDSNSGFIYRSGNIVEREAVYYYVRPGVCQRIVKTVVVPAHVKLVKVRAFFTYYAKRLEISRKEPTLEQRLQREDWTSLVRVVSLDSEIAVKDQSRPSAA